MPNTRRSLIRHLSAAALAASLLPAATAQATYPVKPIRLIVPFTVGGVTDASARMVADLMGKRLGQPINVDNRPGASGNIGTSAVATAEPDGYTLLLGFDGTLVINPNVFRSVPFDTLKDFAPIGKIGDAKLILVAATSLKADTLKEVIELSKKESGGLSYGTSGVGSTPHLGGSMLNIRSGANLVHVAYKGGGQAMIDLQAGSIPLVWTAVAGALPLIQAGRIKPIAVPASERASSLPNVPTFIEAGVKDFVIDSWVGLLAPVRTPRPIVDRLNTVLNEVLNDADARARLDKLGITPLAGTPEQYHASMKRDLERYSEVVKAAKIQAE
ncbi:MAG: tripartite tricarboxylate transporter substrate binding protein [Betaproteobacteria bacterium]|nr:tripartite tricarboxylate transporter substrate binding protein [Betaproteobacteria bacterium]